MKRDSERLVELITEVGQRVSGALLDAIPPEAQTHLLNAQRELLTTLLLIYEHQVGVRRPISTPRARSRKSISPAKAPATSGRPPRRIPVE